MAVWSYAEKIEDTRRLRAAYDLYSRSHRCIFCGDELDLGEFYEDPSYGDNERNYSFGVSSCVCCGWWFASSNILLIRNGRKREVIGAAGGCLKRLDLTDLSTPIADVQTYLTAKYSDRFNMAWQLFEDTVCSVFAGLGYRARVTARSNDGGIDVILDGPGDRTVGVQVKRYKNSIKAAQIRELAGALVLNGLTEGVFVTTSSFQRGAEKSAMLAAARGIPLRLLDAKRFYEALKIAQSHSRHRSFEEINGLIRPSLQMIRLQKKCLGRQ